MEVQPQQRTICQVTGRRACLTCQLTRPAPATPGRWVQCSIGEPLRRAQWMICWDALLETTNANMARWWIPPTSHLRGTCCPGCLKR
jgi:hypothetical protein